MFDKGRYHSCMVQELIPAKKQPSGAIQAPASASAGCAEPLRRRPRQLQRTWSFLRSLSATEHYSATRTRTRHQRVLGLVPDTRRRRHPGRAPAARGGLHRVAPDGGPVNKAAPGGAAHAVYWLVVGQVMPTNPAGSVRGPRHSVKKGKTPVLTAEEARTLLDAIDTSTVVGLRDRALIGLMVYTFARVGAAVQMRAEDVYVQGRRLWVRLHEKGGKEHEMPCHHNLEAWLEAYLQAAELKGSAWLFQTAKGRAGKLAGEPMGQADVFRMIGRRSDAAGIRTKIGCHSFRATGITEYLRNGGKLEIAQRMANHESARTTGLYDRRQDDVSLDEVERILI